MIAADSAPALDRLLEPVTRSMGTDGLQALVRLTADPDFQARLDALAERNTEDELTPEERQEYEMYVHALYVISIMQAKARRILNGSSSD